MAAPTLVAYAYATALNASATNVTTASISWQTGDVVVILTGTEGGTGGEVQVNPTTSGAGLTIGAAQQKLDSDGSDSGAGCWAAVAASNSSGTFSFQATHASGNRYKFLGVYIYRGSAGIGNSAIASAANRVVSLTPTGANGAISWVVVDWATAATVAVTPTATTHGAGAPGPTASPTAVQQSPQFTYYVSQLDDQSSAGAVNYGITGSGTGPFTCIAIEAKGTSSAPTFSVTATDDAGSTDSSSSALQARSILPVTFGATSSAWVAPASGATVTPTYPADDNLDLIVATLAIKPNTATVATPANWTAGPVDAVGSGTQGAGTGAVQGVVFTRVTDGSLSGGSQAFTITGGSSPVGVMHAWKYDATGYTDAQWNPVASTSYSHTSSTTVGGTGAAGLDLRTGDILAYLNITADDAASAITLTSLAASGATLSAITRIPDVTIVNSQGNDISAAFGYSLVTAGSSNAAPVAVASIVAGETGGGIFYRIRATGLVSAQDFTVTPTDGAGSTDLNAVDQAVGALDSAGSTDTSNVALSASGAVTQVDSAGSTDPAGLTQGKVFSDGAGSVDTSTVSVGRGVTQVDGAGSTDYAAHAHSVGVVDGAGSTDTGAASFVLTATAVDAAGSIDSASLILDLAAPADESTGSTDYAAIAESDATVDEAGSTDTTVVALAHPVTAVDTAGSTDTATVVVTKTAAATDTAGSTDTSVTAVGRGVTVTDSAGSSDTLTLAAGYGAAATDSAGSTDTAALAVGYGVAVTDGAGSTDSAAGALTLARSATDDAGSTDTSVVAAGREVTATDSSGSTDTSVLVWTWILAPTDDTGSIDYAAQTRTLVVSDDTGSTDVGVPVLQGAGTFTQVDPAGSTDLVALTRGNVTIDGSGSTDSATVAVGRGVTATDSGGSTDSSVVSVGRGVVATDGAGSTDYVALQRGVGATDTAGSADSASVALSGSGAVTATDSAGSSDSVARTAVYARPATDDTGSSDTATVQLAGAGTVTSVDSAGSTDTAALTRGQTAIDGAGSTDLLPVISIGEALAFLDGAGSSDSTIVTLTPTGVVTVDDAGSTDEWTREAVYLLTIIDTAGATDVAVVTFTPFITSLDYAHANGTLSTLTASATLTTVTASGELLP